MRARPTTFPWVTGQILAGSTVVLSSVEDLPAEAARDAESFRLIGTQSTVIVPLRTHAALLGA